MIVDRELEHPRPRRRVVCGVGGPGGHRDVRDAGGGHRVLTRPRVAPTGAVRRFTDRAGESWRRTRNEWRTDRHLRHTIAVHHWQRLSEWRADNPEDTLAEHRVQTFLRGSVMFALGMGAGLWLASRMWWM